MATPTRIADYYAYANLQLAAEAFLRDEATGVLRDTDEELVRALERGNDHASAFPRPLAQTFADNWRALDQRANTRTGFSGTLFRNTETDELVLSFRSTEFIDDAARDNQATNAMEIRQFGWAFGQIDDMERWYAELRRNAIVKPGDRFTVTGYSLGGHLATAFNFLRKEEAEALGTHNPIVATYTFNGAGAGDILNGRRLTNVIDDFARLRDNASEREIPFSDPRAVALYRELRSKAYQTPEEVGFDIAEVVRRDVAAADSVLLLTALDRMRTILGEVQRLPRLSSGGEPPTSPKLVERGDIDALRLDYQFGGVISSRATAARDASLIGAGGDDTSGGEGDDPISDDQRCNRDLCLHLAANPTRFAIRRDFSHHAVTPVLDIIYNCFYTHLSLASPSRQTHLAHAGERSERAVGATSQLVSSRVSSCSGEKTCTTCGSSPASSLSSGR